MNHPLSLVLAAVLFFLLTPGVLVKLPPKSGLLVVAAFHAVVFTVVYYFAHVLLKNLVRREGLENEEDEKEEKEKNV
jgi:hypothetical protein